MGYEADMICSNCDFKGTVEIPKGISTAEYGHVNPCPTCGCTQKLFPL